MCVPYSFLYILGEAVKPQQWTTFIGFLSSFNVRVFILYGTSECHGVLGCQLLDMVDTDMPMGHSLPGVQCLLIDEQGRTIINAGNSSEIGEIHIGGQEYSF